MVPYASRLKFTSDHTQTLENEDSNSSSWTGGANGASKPPGSSS